MASRVLKDFSASMGASAATVAGLVALLIAAPGASAQETIKIGAPLALTGGLADEGIKQQVAYEMWLERVNERGGINVGGEMHPVELITYDYRTEGDRAHSLAERLIIEDEVHVLTAPFGSGHTQIVAGVAERYETPVIASVASSESVYEEGFEFLFGTLAPNEGITGSLINYVTEHFPEVEDVAVYGRDDVFPRSMAVDFREDAEEFGLNIVHDELYPVGAMDHSGSLSSIASSEPDWIYITGYTQDLILARTQLADLGVRAPVVTMITGPAYQEFIDALGPRANGISSASWWHHNAEYESDDVFGSTSEFYEAFVEREDYDPDYISASAAAALIAVEKAIENAGSLDSVAIRDALAELDIVTFYGPINFREDGMNRVRDLPLIQVQDESVEVLNPPEIATGTIIPMPDSEDGED